MMKKRFLLLCAGVAFYGAVPVFAEHPKVGVEAETSQLVGTYAALVSDAYNVAHKDALTLQKAIKGFLENPDEKTLKAAKDAWLFSRLSYGRTEAFRFYEGPIDGVGADGQEGPEGRLNAWPLDEAYIDYVEGNKQAGLVNNATFEITKDSISGKNQENDEAEVATGYHAIEFLLWGQDLSLDGPGVRPVSDYSKVPENERRRLYLKTVTDLLVDDLKFLSDSWAPGDDNYGTKFLGDPEAVKKIITGLATLSGFELASERMATALDSGDQEDEHSCFSDNTHNDFISNAQGIYDVYFGLKDGLPQAGALHDVLLEKDQGLAEKIKGQLENTQVLIEGLPFPIDREILASEKESEGRKKMEAVIASLQKQADLFKEAGALLGVEITISE